MLLLSTGDIPTHYRTNPYLKVVPGYHSKSVQPSSYEDEGTYLDGACISVKGIIIIDIVYIVYSQHYWV